MPKNPPSAARHAREFEQTGATVDTSLTTLFTSDDPMEDMVQSVLTFEVVNTTSTALSDFELQLEDHSNANEWHTILSGSEWNDNSIFQMLYSNPRLDTLSGNTTGHAHVRIWGRRFRLRAKVGSGSTTIDVRGRYGPASGG